jgi:hypothetical protein
MPWILGLDRKALRKLPHAACADLIAEPWEAAEPNAEASFSGRWEKPNIVRSRRVVRRCLRGAAPEVVPPDKSGKRASLADGDRRAESREETVERVISFWRADGQPADLGAVALSMEELEELGSKELAEAVERAESEGRARVASHKLQRRDETISAMGEPSRVSVRDLERAWESAVIDPATGLPDRVSAWDAACERGAPEMDAIQELCPLCEKGHFACLREVWLDASGVLGLEGVVAAALDRESDRKARESIFGRWPRRTLKRIRGQRASFAKRYEATLRKFFLLRPGTDSEEAQALMGSLFCNAPPTLNAVSPEIRDAWLRDLDELLEREPAARASAANLMGDAEAEELMDWFIALRRLRFHLRAAFVADLPLPLTFSA